MRGEGGAKEANYVPPLAERRRSRNSKPPSEQIGPCREGVYTPARRETRGEVSATAKLPSEQIGGEGGQGRCYSQSPFRTNRGGLVPQPNPLRTKVGIETPFRTNRISSGHSPATYIYTSGFTPARRGRCTNFTKTEYPRSPRI